MAALTRPTEATYTIHEMMTVKTSDREDHTFCGVMFPVECKKELPVERIAISSIWVRGNLGPITVWISDVPDDNGIVQTTASGRVDGKEDSLSRVARLKSGEERNEDKSTQKKSLPYASRYMIRAEPSAWTMIYSQKHRPSPTKLTELDLSLNPIYIEPGQVRGVYVHSTLPNDEAIVYDNYYSGDASETPEDLFLRIRPAMAHVSPTPFGRTPIWGWGDAWRRDRKFVGKLEYGVIYTLWNPKEHLRFGSRFQRLATLLFLCQRRWESPMSRLPDECIFYILNMCKWDWVGDSKKTLAADSESKKRAATASAHGTIGDNESNEEKDVDESCSSSNVVNMEEESDDDDDDNIYVDEIDVDNEYYNEDEVDMESGDDDDSDANDGYYNNNYVAPILYASDAPDQIMARQMSRRTLLTRRFRRAEVEGSPALSEFILSTLGTVFTRRDRI